MTDLVVIISLPAEKLADHFEGVYLSVGVMGAEKKESGSGLESASGVRRNRSRVAAKITAAMSAGAASNIQVK